MYYAEFFRLTELPFSIAPNPRFLFMSERHREALAHLLFGVVNGNGFVALTGEVGTGKTTLCHCLLEQLPENVDLALILNPRVDARELLATLCDELRIPYPGETASLKTLSDALSTHLLETHARGRNTVLLIDEAQNLSFDVLEQIRLLTNLETSETKLLQIILVGQPELNDLLAQRNLRQLNQRITARYHIHPLSLEECGAYIEHRLSVSGARESLFTPGAIRCIHRLSEGIPRVINTICDRALLGAYSTGTHRVSARIVRRAADEVLLPSSHRRSARKTSWKRLAIASLLLLCGLLAAGLYIDNPAQLKNRWIASAPGDTDRSGDPTAEKIDPGPIYRELFAGLASATTVEPGAATGEPRPAAKPLKEPAGKQSGTPPARPPDSVPKPTGNDFVERISSRQLSLYAVLPQLFMQWGIEGEPKTRDLCASARRYGLRCLAQRGTWNEVVRLNRPVALEFSSRRGRSHYATLISIQNDTATLKFDDDTPQTYPVDTILQYWQGNYSLLWKPPAPNVGLLMEGFSDPAVVWLRATLPQLPQGEKNNSEHFGAALKDAVIAFQTRNGLKPDGKVGSATVILINNQDPASGVPRLTRVEE